MRHASTHKTLWFALALLLFPLTSCNRGAKTPFSSTGNPYEVLVVDDVDGMVATALQTDVEGLPQPEPSFDVSSVRSAQLVGSLRWTRAIVIVKLDKSVGDTVLWRVERNPWAVPQTVIHLFTPSSSQLQRSFPRVGTALREMLLKAEYNVALQHLRRQAPTAAQRTLERAMGVKMPIPAHFTQAQQALHWVWLSDGGTAAEECLVAYEAAGAEHASPAQWEQLRDSAMGAWIKGESPSMRMATVPHSVQRFTVVFQGKPIVFWRGLWQMEDGDMGGPFVARTVGNVVVEAFVFAPGKRKRNMMRQLEALLLTAVPANKGKIHN